MSATTEVFPGGIEWFSVGNEEDCQCARCGSSALWRNCWNCGGDGEIDDTDNWEWPTVYSCDWCDGKGGSWHCCSDREWCEANPMPGREQVRSSALRAREWDE